MKPRAIKKSKKDDAGKQGANASSGSSRTGRSGYETCVYLYYLKFGTTGTKPQDVTAHYFFDPKSTITIKNRITILALNAHDLGLYDPTCYGNKFTDLKRRRKGYFVVVVEDACDRKLSKTNGLVFNDDILGDLKPDNFGMHTFGVPEYMEVSASKPNGSTKVLQVAYCANTMKSKKFQNSDLDDGEEEKFQYSLKFADEKARAFPDSGGTNMGPPVPPPVRKKTRKATKRARA